MDRVTWIKNFALCKEVEIAGKFIYDGMLDLNSMLNYIDDENIFSFLYKISVGIERLQKILLVLLKNPDEKEYIEMQKELKTHSHNGLHSKIKKMKDISFSAKENAFIQMLDIFYKKYRYDRYTPNTTICGERDMLSEYVRKNLNKNIETDGIFVTLVDMQTKKYLGKIIGTIANGYYNLICKRSGELNLFVNELNRHSKSMKIFQMDCNNKNLQQHFMDENIAYKELLIFLANTTETSEFFDFLKNIKPLDIDIALIPGYLSEIMKGNMPLSLLEEVDFWYSEISDSDRKERLEMLDCIANSDYCFD